MSKDIDKQIANRRKQAVKKDFYRTGQRIVEKLGKDSSYGEGSIRIERRVFSQQFTGGTDDVEIFFNEKSVFLGRGNEYTSFGEKGIDRYVPGKWEENLEEIALKLEVKTPKQKASKLRDNWGIK